MIEIKYILSYFNLLRILTHYILIFLNLTFFLVFSKFLWWSLVSTYLCTLNLLIILKEFISNFLFLIFSLRRNIFAVRKRNIRAVLNIILKLFPFIFWQITLINSTNAITIEIQSHLFSSLSQGIACILLMITLRIQRTIIRGKTISVIAWSSLRNRESELIVVVLLSC